MWSTAQGWDNWVLSSWATKANLVTASIQTCSYLLWMKCIHRMEHLFACQLLWIILALSLSHLSSPWILSWQIWNFKDENKKFCSSLKRNGHCSFPLEFQRNLQYSVLVVLGREVSKEYQEESGMKIIIWFQRATDPVKLLLWVSTRRQIHNV